MQFTLVAQFNKLIWQDEGQSRFLLQMKNENKSWPIWSNYMPAANTLYTIHGTVTESPDKKVKDQNGKAIYRTQFNAESWTQAEEEIPF